jgi:KDO2-lipid IV(A) lauroyltransferase
MMSWLKDGKAVGVLIDIDSHRVRSEFIPSYGRMAHTPVGQSIMGLKVGAAFVPMACVRTEDDRYKVITRPEVEVDRTGDFDQDVLNVTEKCLRELEAMVEEYRDQWVWMHNRWQTKYPKVS